LRAKTQEAGDKAESQWQEVLEPGLSTSSVTRRRIDERQAAMGQVAENDADWAEADALDAIDYAAAAIEEAEYAVLDAQLARVTADSLRAAAST
jgi:hypothetical protein